MIRNRFKNILPTVNYKRNAAYTHGSTLREQIDSAPQSTCMRELLFKGKTKNERVWIEGNYLKLKICGKSFNMIQPLEYDTYCAEAIIPETVCQYIGRKDKTGKKIFTNDILSFVYDGTNYIGKVVYNDNTNGFELWYNSVVGAFGERATHKIYLMKAENIKVIGNYFDNLDTLDCFRKDSMIDEI